MIRLSFILLSTLALAIAGCGASTPTSDTPAGADAKAPAGGEAKGDAKGYGYEFNADSLKDPKPTEASPPGTIKEGRLAPETIQEVVRQHFGQFRVCYEAGLKKDPKLEGAVKIRTVIKEDGTVGETNDDGSTMPDKEVIACIVSAFGKMTFPKPEGGIVTVVYPIKFSP